jgi:hypothetical protein
VGSKPTHLSASRRTHGNSGGQIRLHRYHTAKSQEIQCASGAEGGLAQVNCETRLQLGQLYCLISALQREEKGFPLATRAESAAVIARA